MTFKFLIDECLSPALVKTAYEFGHFGSTCVRDRGLSGTKDHELIRFAVVNDALEVVEDHAGQITIHLYRIPEA